MPTGLPGDATWAGGYTSPETVASKMLAHKKLLNDKTKLTWDDNAEPIYSTHKMVGDVNLSAPFIRFGTRINGKYYWLQNGKWFLGNGTQTTLEKIVETENTDVWLVDALYKAERAFAEDAARRDPNICGHCLKFRSKTPDDYLRHVLDKHPTVALKASTPVVERVSSAKVPTEECCGKTFKDARGLSAHRKFSKIHKTDSGA